MRLATALPSLFNIVSRFFVLTPYSKSGIPTIGRLDLTGRQPHLGLGKTMSSATTSNIEEVKHVPKELLPNWMLEGRTKVLTESCTLNEGGSSVVYWMQRDVRTKDNWALLLAAHFATTRRVPLRVLYSIPPPPPETSSSVNKDPDAIPNLKDLPMTRRHGMFLLGGLECVYNELTNRYVPLDVVMPESYASVGECVMSNIISPVVVVTDFSPLRHHREWTEHQYASLLEQAKIPLFQVDTHNVVPVWVASPKREYAARTIRPKIQNLLPLYLEKFPKLQDVAQLEANTKDTELPPFKRLVYETFMKMDDSVDEVPWAIPGTDAGMKQAEFFSEHGLKKYDEKRNDPNETTTCSNLSTWLNHGHISFQRLALGIKKLNKYATGSASFLEEGIIRRELSDNYVYYAPDDYDSLTAAYEWAQTTLETHAGDQRQYLYTLEQLANGETHDDLWNAAQLQAVRDGKMHGFLRMYWAKKILEWTKSPKIGLETAQYLNDWFNLDGRDPNGFVGVGWSIMGIHEYVIALTLVLSVPNKVLHPTAKAGKNERSLARSGTW